MRDQVILARNALKNDIPLFTLVGKDKFALQTLEYCKRLSKYIFYSSFSLLTFATKK